MKKTIRATSKTHKWVCGVSFRVEKFRDAGGHTRFQIAHKGAPLVLISKRAIKAMANDEYTASMNYRYYNHRDYSSCRSYSLGVHSSFGETTRTHDRQRIVSIAKCIVRELKIK